ncbi:MAG: class I SAM-dependent methyltransferase [Saprospiraceae bacterium]
MPAPLATYLHWAKAAIRFYRQASTRYDIHSPFLSKWVEAVFEDERGYYIFEEAERVRHYWENVKHDVVFDDDSGAGSRAGQGRVRQVASMIQQSGVDRRTGQLLFKMALFATPSTILELGTNLGLSALYLRAAARNATFISVEAHPEVARLAQKSFSLLRLPPPIIVNDTFQGALPRLLSQYPRLDLVWIDGDHRGGATVAYFEQLLPNLHEQSVVAIGDIHWSADMEAAWEHIRKHPDVTISLDLFSMGVLFFGKESQDVLHYALIPTRFKPWRLGFF